VLAVSQDVTERKRLEAQLHQAQRLEAVGQLAAGIAHEINTPIQYVGDNIRFIHDAFAARQFVLANFRELLQAAEEGRVTANLVAAVRRAVEESEMDFLAEEIPKAIAQSLDGTERVAVIVRAMKEFAHPGQQQKALADLNKSLANALVVARNEIKYVADVQTDFGDVPPILCHIAELNQVFLNLLTNAADAIREVVKQDNQKGLIRVSTRLFDGQAVISISDSGCGIPENIQRRVFDPFFTTKDVGRGSGQGLAIARATVVEKHGGSIWFEPNLPRGTTFVVSLPMTSAPSSAVLEEEVSLA
jgi:signal transduction histidine kinase